MFLIETPFYKAKIKTDGTYKIIPKAYVPEKKKTKDLPRYPLITKYENEFKKNYTKSFELLLEYLTQQINLKAKE